MKYIFVLLINLLIVSCFFGPVKELKYQIEDSLDLENPEVLPRKILDIVQTKQAEILWSAELNDKPNSYPNFHNNTNTLFVISTSGNLIAFNQDDGSIKWSKDFNIKVSSGLTGNNSVVIFIAEDGYIYCVDVNGVLIWKSFFGKVITQPIVLDNKIIVRRNDNFFSGIDLLEGNSIWNYQAPSFALSINMQGQMIFSDGVIYSGLPGAKLIALEASTGLLIWETTISRPKGTSDIDRMNDITSQPIIDNALIFTVSMNGDIACIDRKTSEILWTRPFSSYVGITDHLDEVLVVHKTDSIYSFNKISGKSNWRNPKIKGRSLTKGIVVDDTFIVGDFSGYLHLFNIDSGEIIGRTLLKSKASIINIAINETDNTFYALNENGVIFKLKLIDVDIPINSENTISNIEEKEDGSELAKESKPKKWLDKLKDAIIN